MKELDAKIAEWCGLVPCPVGWLCERCKGEVLTNSPDWLDPEIGTLYEAPPRYSSDLNEMIKVERLILERRKEFAYICSLCDIVFGRGGLSLDKLTMRELFLLASATAEQRAKALCEVIDSEKKNYEIDN